MRLYNVNVSSLPLYALDLNSAHLFQRFELFFINVAVDEFDKRLNFLLYTVQTVAHHVVQGIQKRENDLKCTQPCMVRRILEQRNHAVCVGLRFYDLAIADEVEHAVCID